MDNEIKYIGTFTEEEIKQKSSQKTNNKVEKNKPKFKINKHNIKVSKFILSTKSKLLNKKVIFGILIVLLIYTLKPITFLKLKLEQKREYYAQMQNNSITCNKFFDSLIYASGADYYKNCKDKLVSPADGLITCQFDWAHQGIDIACYEYPGNIYAAANGHVCYIGYSKKYGNEVLIEHEINGITLYTYYANLSVIYVTNGQYVNQNEVIALEGGNPEKPAQIMDSDGHHLHFEVRKNKNSGSGLNPIIFIQ